MTNDESRAAFVKWCESYFPWWTGSFEEPPLTINDARAAFAAGAEWRDKQNMKRALDVLPEKQDLIVINEAICKASQLGHSQGVKDTIEKLLPSESEYLAWIDDYDKRYDVGNRQRITDFMYWIRNRLGKLKEGRE